MKPPQVAKKRDGNPSLVITVITIAIILLFASFIVYRVKLSPTEDVMINCAPGQCATNMFSGLKSCPQGNEVVAIDPAEEVCNSPFTCEDPKTPYALKGDGSTDLNGVCETGIKCRCLQRPRCADYVTTYFQTSNGNPYQPLGTQRIVFSQVYDYTDLADNYQIGRPLEYLDPATEFCAIPALWFRSMRVWPETCPIGTLVFVPDDPGKFNNDTKDNFPLSCVIGDGTECGPNEAPFWNSDVNKIACLPASV